MGVKADCANTRMRECAIVKNDRQLAGQKRLALLRASVVDAGIPGSRVLQGIWGPDAGRKLAAGKLRISAGLCDKLIDLMATLKSDPARHEIAGLAVVLAGCLAHRHLYGSGHAA